MRKGKLTVENGIIQYKASTNKKYLIDEYYYTEVLPREEYKVHKHLFNKLRAAKLEDALLYELAMKYLKEDEEIVEKAKSKVSDIQSSEISFDIKDYYGNHLYTLIVPFNKLETLSILIRYKTGQENELKNKKTSFLGNIYHLLAFLDKNYKQLSKYKDDGGFKKIVKNFKNKKRLSFVELNTINGYIISGAVKFSKVHMELERYFINKHKIKANHIYIDLEDIKDDSNKQVFGNYYDSKLRIRNKAFHFGVPTNFFFNIEIEKIEKKFILEEVKLQNVSSFDKLNQNAKSVCRVFMEVLHSDLYRRDKNKSKEELRREFEEKYFNEIITTV